MKQKPVKPVKTPIVEKVGVLDGMSLQYFIEYFAALDITDFSAICIDEEYYGYDDGKKVYFIGQREETDAEFAVRMEKYQKELKAYNAWYKNNKEEIEALKRKKKETTDALLKKRQARLKRELEKVEKQLK